MAFTPLVTIQQTGPAILGAPIRFLCTVTNAGSTAGTVSSFKCYVSPAGSPRLCGNSAIRVGEATSLVATTGSRVYPFTCTFLGSHMATGVASTGPLNTYKMTVQMQFADGSTANSNTIGIVPNHPTTTNARPGWADFSDGANNYLLPMVTY